ncbi:chromosome partitioning protein ParA [Vibrio viridaestus]|uniref:Chromosome partitioning protein ParA n=1 Tax=Vibrio viridaestus TaxID=2487322 RepID=A0A3N9THA7_9VIBR|nr:chromosome partitioning protein ParA [Vibrio viridaestus]RQW63607.1 chromosome partitioning protein ParA [Vibrio viridaestus]
MKTKNDDHEHDEDVVIIEQRDKKSVLYIAIAALIGLAAGGLIGAAVASNHWEGTYTDLENNIKQMDQSSASTLAQAKQENDEQIEKLKSDYEEQIEKLKQQQDEKVSQLQDKLKQLESQKQQLDKKVSSKDSELKTAESKNQKLNQKADMQASVFERSRELFQKELTVKQELEKLEKEKADLNKKLKVFKTECDAYLNGTSWDAHSDACDKQDEANSRISQVDQLIRVHQMDLKQIKALTNDLGLDQ